MNWWQSLVNHPTVQRFLTQGVSSLFGGGGGGGQTPSTVTGLPLGLQQLLGGGSLLAGLRPPKDIHLPTTSAFETPRGTAAADYLKGVFTSPGQPFDVGGVYSSYLPLLNQSEKDALQQVQQTYAGSQPASLTGVSGPELFSAGQVGVRSAQQRQALLADLLRQFQGQQQGAATTLYGGERGLQELDFAGATDAAIASGQQRQEFNDTLQRLGVGLLTAGRLPTGYDIYGRPIYGNQGGQQPPGSQPPGAGTPAAVGNAITQLLSSSGRQPGEIFPGVPGLGALGSSLGGNAIRQILSQLGQGGVGAGEAGQIFPGVQGLRATVDPLLTQSLYGTDGASLLEGPGSVGESATGGLLAPGTAAAPGGTAAAGGFQGLLGAPSFGSAAGLASGVVTAGGAYFVGRKVGQAIGDALEKGGQNQFVTTAASSAGGAASGAVVGAMVGDGPGAVIGAIVGGLSGGSAGLGANRRRKDQQIAQEQQQTDAARPAILQSAQNAVGQVDQLAPPLESLAPSYKAFIKQLVDAGDPQVLQLGEQIRQTLKGITGSDHGSGGATMLDILTDVATAMRSIKDNLTSSTGGKDALTAYLNSGELGYFGPGVQIAQTKIAQVTQLYQLAQQAMQLAQSKGFTG